MALTNLLSVAQTALLAQERAVGVIGHNIANAATPGYTRQRARLAAQTPANLPPIGQVGRGVELTGIDRLRSNFFDDSWRREAGTGSRFGTIAATLSQASGVLGEPSDAGIAAAIDDLIDSFNDVAANPVDPTARAVALANAQALADRFQSVDRRLEGLAASVGADLAQEIGQANALIEEIGQLNAQIRVAGGNAPDLLDRRDNALDQLSQKLDIRVLERGKETVDVLLGGIQLVTSTGGTQALSVSGTGPYQIGVGNPAAPISVSNGRVAGLLDAFTQLGTRGTPTARATGLRGQLDDLVTGLVTAVNQIHSDYDPTTKPLQPTLTPAPSPLRTVIPLFDPAGVTAGTVRLNPAVVADPTQFAAGYSTAAGDNAIAFRLAELRTLAVSVPGATGATSSSPAVAAGPAAVLGEYYTGVIGGLGVRTNDADQRAASQDVLVDHLESQRQEVSGVNVDEEMVRLIEHQQAYAAAARLVQVADEMLRELINLGR